jgi:uncharacterized protein (TIGR01777 family)
MKVLISGASGLIGTALTDELREHGHAVGHLVRPGATARAGDVRWDPATGSADLNAIEGVEAVVNLGGASIGDGRWTPERKKILRTSRVDSTRVLVDSLARLKKKPRAFLSASAVGYYGDRGDEVLTETSRAGEDFLAQLARDWEAEAMRAEASGMRTVILRFSVVLSQKGGALARMLTPFRIGVGGRLGSGKQWMSWVALEDAARIARFALGDEKLRGAINVAAPNPVQNSDFTRVLASVLHRPAIFPAPAFVLRLALGEMADALLLSSQRALPERLLGAGYEFRFDRLETALPAVLERKS